MPELPEVEVIARDLNLAGIIHCKIQQVLIHWERTIATPSSKEFVHRLIGQEILSISRRAKYLVFHLSSGDFLYIHLRMTGRFTLGNWESPIGTYERLTLRLEDGRSLQYLDTRKFGRWFLVQDQVKFSSKLGPEPLEDTLTNDLFFEKLLSKKRQLKPLLLDQSFLAGLGNIYVDEALWEAQLHPLSLSQNLSKKEASRLLEAIRHVLKRGLATQGTTLGKGKSNFYRLAGEKGTHQESLNVFRRTGLPCPRCGKIIHRIIVGQRSTHICLFCQKKL
jgi:formamidopyrimidine-DNA glycosylase